MADQIAPTRKYSVEVYKAFETEALYELARFEGHAGRPLDGRSSAIYLACIPIIGAAVSAYLSSIISAPTEVEKEQQNHGCAGHPLVDVDTDGSSSSRARSRTPACNDSEAHDVSRDDTTPDTTTSSSRRTTPRASSVTVTPSSRIKRRTDRVLRLQCWVCAHKIGSYDGMHKHFKKIHPGEAWKKSQVVRIPEMTVGEWEERERVLRV